MQATDGRGTFWFKCQRSTESGKQTGNQSEGSSNEKGNITSALIRFVPILQSLWPIED